MMFDLECAHFHEQITWITDFGYLEEYIPDAKNLDAQCLSDPSAYPEGKTYKDQ